MLTKQETYDKIKQYILIMLGSPVVKVELNDEQLDFCVRRTCELMNESTKVNGWCDVKKLMVAQDGAYAQAKIVLGRIRSKYGLDSKEVIKTNSKPNVYTQLTPVDGRQLLEEGEFQYVNWKYKVFE